MPATITIDARVVGRRTPIFADWRVEIPDETERPGHSLTLRALIERVVREEVRAFKERRERRRLPGVLSPAEIDRAVLAGKVDPGGRESEPDVEPEAAVATALQGFEDGLYYVFLDGQQQERLDQEVHPRADSHLSFLRLVALAGG